LSSAERQAVLNTEPVKAESIGIRKAARGPSTPHDRAESNSSSYSSRPLSCTLRCFPRKMKPGAMGFIAIKSGTAFGLQLAKP